MSLLVIARTVSGRPDARWPAALAEAERQGYSQPLALRWQGGLAHWYPTPGNPRGSGACVQHPDGRFAAYVGTLHWGRLTGAALLRALMERDATPAALPLDELMGSGVLLLGRDDGPAWLFNDLLGIHKHYQTTDGALRSTSFMVCRATLDRLEVDPLRAREYVLLGANHAEPTPLRGICTADPTLAYELGERRTEPLSSASHWRRPCPYGSFDAAVEDLAGHIGTQFADMAAAFGSDIGMALSGGMDSRLLLAALDHVGVTPTLYVYGSPADADVRVAREIAAGLGLAIECIDKAAVDAQRVPPAPGLPERLPANLAFFDGLPPDGALDAGADRETRLLQVQHGRLNLNGGGGEILRNFFYLRDRSFTPLQLAQAFYSNWPANAFADPRDAAAMRLSTAQGIARNLSLDGPDAVHRPLPRGDVELVYTLFRLRWWMGRNNSLAGRYGAFLTPFVQPRLARLAASLPLPWKDYGRLECALIRRLSPRVAQGPSAYGFSFATGPDWRQRARVLATALRPTWLRAQSANLRRALGRAQPATLPPDWLALQRLLPPQPWLNAGALPDLCAWNRLLTLQAVATPDGWREAAPQAPSPTAAPC